MDYWLKKKTENLLGDLPYQFELEFNSDGPENHMDWVGGLTWSHTTFILGIPQHPKTNFKLLKYINKIHVHLSF